MCLQNLLSFLPVQSWSSPFSLQQMWEALLQTVLEKGALLAVIGLVLLPPHHTAFSPCVDGQADSADLLEAVLGALRGLLVHLDIQVCL